MCFAYKRLTLLAVGLCLTWFYFFYFRWRSHRLRFILHILLITPLVSSSSQKTRPTFMSQNNQKCALQSAAIWHIFTEVLQNFGIFSSNLCQSNIGSSLFVTAHNSTAHEFMSQFAITLCMFPKKPTAVQKSIKSGSQIVSSFKWIAFPTITIYGNSMLAGTSFGFTKAKITCESSKIPSNLQLSDVKNTIAIKAMNFVQATRNFFFVKKDPQTTAF